MVHTHRVMEPMYENGIPTKKVKMPPMIHPWAAIDGVLAAMQRAWKSRADRFPMARMKIVAQFQKIEFGNGCMVHSGWRRQEIRPDRQNRKPFSGGIMGLMCLPSANQKPVPYLQSVEVSHLVTVDGLISNRVCSIVGRTIFRRRTPLRFVVTTQRIVVRAWNTRIHVADPAIACAVRVDVIGEANRGWWCFRIGIGKHVIRKYDATCPAHDTLGGISVRDGEQPTADRICPYNRSGRPNPSLRGDVIDVCEHCAHPHQVASQEHNETNNGRTGTQNFYQPAISLRQDVR